MNIISTIVFCAIIVCCGLYVIKELYHASKDLDSILERFNSEIVREEIEYTENVGDEFVTASDYRKIHYDRGKLAENKNKYYKTYADYVAISQLISIFPLLGIMGTVLGLVLNFNGSPEEVINKLVGGLAMALLTTLIGLIFSVLLKWADACILGKKVNLIDSEFEKAENIIQHQTIAEEIKQSVMRKE